MAGYLADGALYKQRSPTGPDLKPALICTSCMRGEPAGSLQIRPESRACTTRMPGGRWYGLPTIQRTKQITPGLPTDSATPLHRYTATPLHRYPATHRYTATLLHRYTATPLLLLLLLLPLPPPAAAAITNSTAVSACTSTPPPPLLLLLLLVLLYCDC